MKLTICLIWLAGLVAVSGDETSTCIALCTSDMSSARDHCCDGMRVKNWKSCCKANCSSKKNITIPCDYN
ncbi:uncharacterized protein PHALS_14511 [Plasmopara halstedii]|uniref:RxLR-like protein n=1 Tax=Plasmopara halstedii TaxID=4781 RepID=A0A0P1AJB9_PLAHL|nr:uncharacterized protein PHALS_14511 [Plasmopara halstedii]CEG41193.1 hypothetical protein PHALS_14511 [Plasmopara halstedii]|eukprot:XP_024577562.1 hypothetical protein PHALS_14511 [Plasmopara halstedii]